MGERRRPTIVMPGLVPGIRDFKIYGGVKPWMAGS